MPAPVEAFYVQQYATNVTLLVQQKTSRLQQAVTVGSYKGEAASPVDQIGAIEAQQNEGRNVPIRPIEAPTDVRWLYPTDYNIPQYVYGFDKLRMIVDPMNSYNKNAAAGMNRRKDREIINAFFADARTGKNGANTTPFLAANVVPVTTGGGASNVGLNVPKLRAAKTLLLGYDLDEDEEIYMAVSAKQLDNLLNEIQVVSSDFNGGDKPVLKDGKVERFLGINFIRSELLPLDANGFRRNPVWAKSGMHLGLWNDIKNDISIRKDLENLPYQLYSEMTLGATRLEEKKVVEVKNAEA